jgi:tetratricopeptide (TPR) repeat protein
MLKPGAKSRKTSKTGPSTGARLWSALGIFVLLLGTAAVLYQSGFIISRAERGSGRSSASTLEEERKVFMQYGGSESCRNCHQEAYQLWEGSNHGLAERAPAARVDNAAFEPARSFKHGSQWTGVRLEGTNYLVSSLGLSLTNEAHPVVRVIGHDPLRQFLVAFSGGRLQTLEAAYAPDTNEWFDVYGEEDRQPGEWGHWTGRGMNWNSMCAGCHNTRVRKNYDGATDAYRTTMAELTVGCESCHGPLRAHNEWQQKYGTTAKKDPTVPRFTRQQILDNCGFCHARRSDLTGDFKPGDSFFDHQSLAIVDQSDRYYPDGQVREEDYEFAAFLGSRMHTNGVFCLDCHNPHSMKTVLPGNWLCLRCHNGSFKNAPAIDPVSHSHHRVFGYSLDGKLVNSDLMAYKPKQIGETGGECVNCHMPQTAYMQRHWRHDHGFTIPDPLLTRQHGIPNACNRCHSDKSVDWALEACAKWYGAKMERLTRRRAQVIARARAGDPAAREPLLELLESNESSYWKGVAAGLLGQWVARPEIRDALLKSLQDAHPLVREQAVRALEPMAGQTGTGVGPALRRLLDDPVLSVRVAAAWALRNDLPADTQAARELEHYLKINSDQPAGQMQLGVYAMGKGHSQQAIAHYWKAATWDSNSAPIRHDLAVALSSVGQTREAIQQLEEACRLDPKEAEYEFKLGLAWNEQGSREKAMDALERAVAIEPRHARAWFNLGLERNSSGQAQAALEALLRAEALAPGDPQIPYARATILAAEGRTHEAKRAAQRSLDLNPSYGDALRLMDELSRMPPGK